MLVTNQPVRTVPFGLHEVIDPHEDLKKRRLRIHILIHELAEPFDVSRRVDCRFAAHGLGEFPFAFVY
jgi:hypothetical protein